MQRFSMLISSLAVWGILAGCGGSSRDVPETVPVAGTITLDGRPLEGAEVRFVKDGFAGVGVTGPDGTYELSPGAVPGMNEVTVSKIEGEGMSTDPEEGMDAGQMEAATTYDPALAGTPGAQGPPQETLPSRYSVPGESELEFDVPADGTEQADFPLQSE